MSDDTSLEKQSNTGPSSTETLNSNTESMYGVFSETNTSQAQLEQQIQATVFGKEVEQHKKSIEKSSDMAGDRSSFSKFFESTGGKALMIGTGSLLARKFLLKPIKNLFSGSKGDEKAEDKKEGKDSKESAEDLEKMSFTDKIKHIAKKALMYGMGAGATRYAIKKLVFEKKSITEAIQDLNPIKSKDIVVHSSESEKTAPATTNEPPTINETDNNTTTPDTNNNPTDTNTTSTNDVAAYIPDPEENEDNEDTSITNNDDNTSSDSKERKTEDDKNEYEENHNDDIGEKIPEEEAGVTVPLDEEILEDSEFTEEASLLNETRIYNENLESIKKKEHDIYHYGMLPFELFVKKYSTWRISNENIAKSQGELAEIFTNNQNLDGEGLLTSIFEYKRELESFKPNADNKEYHAQMLEKVDQWLLTIADAFEYNLNKNIKSYPLALEIYSSFINQIKGKNPEKTEKLTMPSVPSEDDVLEHIKKTKSKEEYHKVNQRILDHGINSLLAPTPEVKQHGEDVLELFRESMDALNQKYKLQLHNLMKQFDGIQSSLTMTPSEKKALNGAIDHLGASENYFFGLLDLDWENESSTRILQVAGSIVLVVGGVIVTIGSLGLGSGVGAVMIAGGVGGLSAVAITHLNSYINGIEASTTDYLVDATLGTLTIGMSKYYAGARAVMRSVGASSGQFFKSYSKEVFINLGLYSGVDVVRGNLNWENTAHNLAWALLPTFLETGPARRMLQWIPNKLRGLQKEKMTQYMKEFEEAQLLAKSARPGDKEKAKKIIESLNKKIAKERQLHSQRIRDYINGKEKEWKEYADKAEELNKSLKAKGGFDKLSPEEQKLRKEIHVKGTAIQQEIKLMEMFHDHVIQGDTASIALNGLKKKIFPSLKAGDSASKFELDEKFTLSRDANGKITLDEKKGGLAISKSFDTEEAALKHISTMFDAKPSMIARTMTYGIEQMGGNIHVLDGKRVSILVNGKKQKYTIKVVENTDAHGVKTKNIELFDEHVPIDPDILKKFESSLHNKIIKEIDSKYLLMTRNVTWMNTPLAKMGKSETRKRFWDSEMGTKLQHYAGTLGKKVYSWTLGDFMTALDKIKYHAKEGIYMQKAGFATAGNDFMELVMGKGTLNKTANLLMMYSLMGSETEESAMPLPLQYIYYRVAGIPIIGYEIMEMLIPVGKGLYNYVAPTPSSRFENVDLE